jgi:hypothetical protein
MEKITHTHCIICTENCRLEKLGSQMEFMIVRVLHLLSTPHMSIK